MLRTFRVEVLVCPWCGGRRRLSAGVFDPAASREILKHLGLPSEAPEVAAARSPPRGEVPW